MIADQDTTLATLANFPEKENWSDKNAFNIPPNQIFPGQKPMTKVRCHNCGQTGHKSTYCQEEPITKDELHKILAQDEMYNA